MNNLFYEIVKLFKFICAITQLTYEELNILVYCFMIPCSWFAIAWLRNIRNIYYFSCLLINVLVTFLYFSKRAMFTKFSTSFYNKNIKYLLELGQNQLQGYIWVSLFIGLLVPFVMYGVLWFINKKYLPPTLLIYVVGLTVYLVGVFFR